MSYPDRKDSGYELELTRLCCRMYLIKQTPKDPRKLEMCKLAIARGPHTILNLICSLSRPRLRLQQLPVSIEGG